MRRNWKRTSCLFVGAVLLITLIGLTASQSGSRAVAEDPPAAAFVPAADINGNEFEALQDMALGGLMWGKDIDRHDHKFNTEGWVNWWQENYPEQAGGYTDWRPATITEVLDALDHGLLAHLDFSYDAGFQGANTELPADHFHYDPDANPPLTWGDIYFWTGCTATQGKRFYRYKIRYGDGHYELTAGEGLSVIPVRGAPPNHDRCPRKVRPPKK